MSTIGWLFILTSMLVLRQVSKGRVMDTATDISDAFLAIVNGDNKAFTEVLSRTGDFNKPDQGAVGQEVGEWVNPPTMGGRYKLGKVKPQVTAAVNVIGPMFGIKTVGGWRAIGSVPGSSHPLGLAADMMIDDIPDGHAVGEKLANYAVANAAKFGITQVIWNRRIWTPSQGWHAYNGPSPHTDHVHLTFKA